MPPEYPPTKWVTGPVLVAGWPVGASTFGLPCLHNPGWPEAGSNHAPVGTNYPFSDSIAYLNAGQNTARALKIHNVAFFYLPAGRIFAMDGHRLASVNFCRYRNLSLVKLAMLFCARLVRD